MNKNKISLIAAIALSAAGLSFNAANAADTATTVDAGGKTPAAQCAPGGKGGNFGHKRGGHHGRRGGGDFMKAFGFTTEQLEKMNSLKLSFQTSTSPKKAELMNLHRELRDNMTKPGTSKSELLSLQSKINTLRADLATSKISYMADKMALMTDDQKAKIREFSLKRGMGGGHGKGHFRGGKGGHFRGHGGPGSRGSFDGNKASFGNNQPAPVAPVAPSEV